MKDKRKSNIVSHLLIVLGGFALAIFLFGSSQALVAKGNADEKALIEAHYPNIKDTRIDNCTLCHISTFPVVFNSYGQAFIDAGMSDAAFTAIENLDSDGDGWTNLQEIQFLKYPGDASDHPVRFFVPVIEK